MPASRFSDGDTMEDGDTVDNYTLDDATYGESTLGETIESNVRRKAESQINIMDHVDNAVMAIGNVLGGLGALLSPKDLVPNLTDENDDTEQNSKSGGTVEDATNFSKAMKFKTTHGKATNSKGITSEYDWMGYMEKFLFPKGGEGDGEGDDVHDGSDTRVSTVRSNGTVASDIGDDYLLQQAVAAARAIHHIHGIQFDELQEINVVNDIKFVVVSVALPLGRKFVWIDLFTFFYDIQLINRVACLFLLCSIVPRTRGRFLGIESSTRRQWCP